MIIAKKNLIFPLIKKNIEDGIIENKSDLYIEDGIIENKSDLYSYNKTYKKKLIIEICNLDLNELIESENNFYKEQKYLKINVLDRYSSNYMRGTDIRNSITNGGTEWKKHFPRGLISYIEENFPKYLILEKILEKKHYDE